MLITSSPDTTRPSCHNRTRLRRSCKVPRSPRSDSLSRTVLPLQHLAHVRPAVRASNRIDTSSVNSTYRHNREYRSTNYDRHQLPTSIIQQYSTTRPTSAFNYDHPTAFYDSSDLSLRLRSSSCILRLVRPQPSTSIIQLYSSTRPTPAFNFDHPAAFYDSTDLSLRLRSSSCLLRLVRPQLSTSSLVPYIGFKGVNIAARSPGGSLDETRSLKASSLPLFLLQSHASDRSPEQAPGSRRK